MLSELNANLENKKINLLDFNSEDLVNFLVSIKEKPYRASQIIKWVHQLGATDFSLMTNLSKELRAYLSEHTEVKEPEIVSEAISKDGTRKWLLKLSDGALIETVFIPENDRGTLCISSQVGCALQCTFCRTGELGFKRNLSVAEIIGQLWLAVRLLAPKHTTKEHAVTNVVLMGMGEPLLNFDNVVKALDLMFDDFAYNLSKYRVTVSTSGIVPAMRRLAGRTKASLAISLHAPNDELRDKLMPINKKYPLKDLIASCKEYYKNDPRRRITIEYIMLEGINDSSAQARELVRLLQGLPCKINLIPCNFAQNKEVSYRPTKQDKIDVFRQILMNAGFNTITRKSRGQDIAAACGQLAGQNK